MRPLSDVDLLRELEPVVAAGLDRHLAAVQEWLPHEWVPWTRGRDFAGEAGQAWTPEQSQLTGAVQAAFQLNLLTEDNLPSYHHELAVRFGLDTAWGTWVRRWSAEEARHAMSIRDYLMLARAVDPVSLERDRMATMEKGWTAAGKDVLQSLVYVTVQELVTRIAHRNTGKAAGDPVAERLLARIAVDENLHMVFYRDLIAAALSIAPEQTVVALATEIRAFQMPGAGIPGFLHKSVQIAQAGIYDVRIHCDEVLAPLLRHWQVLECPVTTAAARQAQADLVHHLDRVDVMARRYEARHAPTDSAVTPPGERSG
jgi:acyl-[acyl-carrier-protein] desaturase